MANDIGNIMSRLQGLKHVSGRRVKELPEVIQNMEGEFPDVSGTSQSLPNFSNSQTPQSNIPEADMGGSLTPQSYDVRANIASPPEKENFWTYFGKSLANQAFHLPNIPSNKSNTSAEQQLPEDLDSVGSMTSPQSYKTGSIGTLPEDFNQQMQNSPTVPPEKENFWTYFGKSIANQNFHLPNIPSNKINASTEPELPEDLDSVGSMASPQSYKTGSIGTLPEDFNQKMQNRSPAPEPSPGILGAISDYFNPTKRNQMGEYNKDLVQDAQILSQGKNPDEERRRKNETGNLTHDQNRALQEPWQYSAYGSAEQVASHPALSAEFEKITGIDYEPQIAQQVSQYEEAMKGIEDSYNGLNTQLSEQAQAINERILNNQTTDADKYYIGLALLMPLIIGGIFGKEAALGALGGASKGVADVLGGRQKSIREDEASLLDVNKQQAGIQEKLGNIGLEKAKFGQDLRKNVPENPEAHLEGLQEGFWKDPVTGKEVRGIEMKPGLIAKPQFVSSKEGKANMLKAADELSETKTYVDEVNDLTQDVLDIVTQLKEPNIAWQALTSILTKKNPTMLSKLSQDVTVDGRKINAGIALEEKLGFLANAYGMAKDIGQLDRAAQNHIKKIIENPTSTFLSPEDAKNQILEVRKLAQKGLVNSAKNKGFYPEFIISDIEKSNNPLFQKMNQKEDDKYNAELKKKAFQGEVNYAQ